MASPLEHGCLYAPGRWGECLELKDHSNEGSCSFNGKPSRGNRRRTLFSVAELPSSKVPEPIGGPYFSGEAPLRRYQRIVRAEPCPTEAAFQTYRLATGGRDDYARRLLLGSCLRLALKVVLERSATDPEAVVLDRIEAANTALAAALVSFTGFTLAEFVPYAEQLIRTKLDSVTE